MPATDQVLTILERLQDSGRVALTAVVSIDGTLIASTQTAEMDATSFAVVTTNGLMVAATLGQTLGRGGIEGAIFEYGGGTMLIAMLNASLALILLAGPAVSLGQLWRLARRYRDTLAAGLDAW